MLAFKIGQEEYGMDILAVQEIRGYENVTRIASAPSFMKGVVNLRGVIVPIMDMRIWFDLPEITYNSTTVVIVLNLGGATIGVVVDSVSDVILLSDEQIRPSPEVSSSRHSDYFTGIGLLGERMLILVDMERLISSANYSPSEQHAA